jgi:anaerobic selenocysteine-containing dehydrogenase
VDLATCQDVDLLRILGDRSRSNFDHVSESRVVVQAPAVFGWVLSHVLPESGWSLAPDPLVSQLLKLGEPPRLALIPRRQPRRLNSAIPGGSAGRVDLPEVLLHPDDAADFDIAEGVEVEVSSTTGSLRGTAHLDTSIRRGAVSIPHGFAEPNVGRLTSATVGVDELTGMVLQSGVALTISAI